MDNTYVGLTPSGRGTVA